MRWENRSTPTKTGPIANLNTTDHAWLDLELSPGLYGGRPATNGHSQGKAQQNATFLHANLKRPE